MFYDPDDDLGGLDRAVTLVARFLYVKHLARQFFSMSLYSGAGFNVIQCSFKLHCSVIISAGRLL